MEQALKGIGAAVIGVGIMVGLVVVILLLLQGEVWLSAKLYPWLVALNGLTFAVLVFVLLPNAVFSSTPKFAGNGMFIASYVFGATLWVRSLLVTYTLWGGIGLAIGLFMAGVGVVPLALLATLFNGLWSTLGELVLGLILTIGVRVWGLRLLEKAARQPA